MMAREEAKSFATSVAIVTASMSVEARLKSSRSSASVASMTRPRKPSSLIWEVTTTMILTRSELRHSDARFTSVWEFCATRFFAINLFFVNTTRADPF